MQFGSLQRVGPLRLPVESGLGRIHAYGLLAIGSILAWFCGSMTLSACYTLALVGAALLYERRLAGIDVFSPFAFFTFLFFAGFGLRPLFLTYFLTDFYKNAWLFYHVEFFYYGRYAILCGQLGYLAFLLGYQRAERLRKPHAVRTSPAGDGEIARNLALALSVVGAGCFFLYVYLLDMDLFNFLRWSPTIDKGGKYILQYGAFLFPLGNIPFLAYLRGRKGLLVRALYLLHFLAAAAISVSFHDRKWFVYFLLSLAVYYHYRVRRLHLVSCILLFAGVVAALMVLQEARNTAYTYGSHAWRLWDRNFVSEQLLTGGMFSYFDYFAYTISAFETEPYLTGYCVRFFAESFIPSWFLGAEKLPAVSHYVAQNYLSHVAEAPAGSLFGEAYVEGGIGAILLALPCVGYFFRRFYARTIGAKNDIGTVLLYIVFFQAYCIVVRTGFMSATIFFIAMAVQLKLILWGLSLRTSPHERPRPAGHSAPLRGIGGGGGAGGA
ncbi:MAG: O-antigen polymerase, partial [Planctomycetota bacterium]